MLGTGPPFLADAIVVSPEDQEIWSFAQRFTTAASPRDN